MVITYIEELYNQFVYNFFAIDQRIEVKVSWKRTHYYIPKFGSVISDINSDINLEIPL